MSSTVLNESTNVERRWTAETNEMRIHYESQFVTLLTDFCGPLAVWALMPRKTPRRESFPAELSLSVEAL